MEVTKYFDDPYIAGKNVNILVAWSSVEGSTVDFPRPPSTFMLQNGAKCVMKSHCQFLRFFKMFLRFMNECVEDILC